MPGAWRTDATPFLREIQDSPSPDSGVELTVGHEAGAGGRHRGATECGRLVPGACAIDRDDRAAEPE